MSLPFLLMPTSYRGQASIKAVCKLFFTFSVSHCSFFYSSLWKKKQLCVHRLFAFLKIFCALWYLKVLYGIESYFMTHHVECTKWFFSYNSPSHVFLNKLTYLLDALSKNIMLSWQILSKTANSEWNQCKAVTHSHTWNICSTKQLTVLNFFQIVGHI